MTVARKIEPEGAVRAYRIVREDGEQPALYLTTHDKRTLLFHWSTDRAGAMVFENLNDAAAVADLALREYGIRTRIVSFLTMEVIERQPTGTAKAWEFPKIKANETEQSAHCDAHKAFTDGCSGCYDAHRSIATDYNRRRG